MKRYVGFFLVIILCFFAQAEKVKTTEVTPADWIDEGFVKLDVSEQKKMISDLQNLLASLNSHAELLAINPNFEWNPILKAFFISTCHAATEAEFRNTVRVTESKATTWTGASQDNANMFKKTGNIKYATSALSNLIAEAHRLNGNARLADSAAQMALRKQFTEVKSGLIADAKKYGVLSSINTMLYNQESIFQKITGDTVIVKQGPSVNAKSVEVVPVTKKANVSLVSLRTTADDFSACLYAGFIIHGPVCKAPRELPQDDRLRELFNLDKFKCASSQVMCNPLIFGFEGSCKDAKFAEDLRSCLNEVKPVCIANSVSATLNCKEKTNHERYSENALTLVNAKPSLLKKLVNDSLKLCDEKTMALNGMINKNANGSFRKNAERIKKDIMKTCLVARPQIIAIMKLFEAKSKNTAGTTSHTTGPAGSRK